MPGPLLELGPGVIHCQFLSRQVGGQVFGGRDVRGHHHGIEHILPVSGQHGPGVHPPDPQIAGVGVHREAVGIEVQTLGFAVRRQDVAVVGVRVGRMGVQADGDVPDQKGMANFAHQGNFHFMGKEIRKGLVEIDVDMGGAVAVPHGGKVAGAAVHREILGQEVRRKIGGIDELGHGLHVEHRVDLVKDPDDLPAGEPGLAREVAGAQVAE